MGHLGVGSRDVAARKGVAMVEEQCSEGGGRALLSACLREGKVEPSAQGCEICQICEICLD